MIYRTCFEAPDNDFALTRFFIIGPLKNADNFTATGNIACYNGNDKVFIV